MSSPRPSESHDDGSAVWDVDPFEITADPATVTGPAVTLDGRTITPTTALALAEALTAAAMHARRRALPDLNP